MRKAILFAAVGAVAIALASFTRPISIPERATLASVSHLELMLATSSLPEAEPSSTF